MAFDASLVGIISTLLLIGMPIVVGLVTKHSTHPGLRATLLLVLSALAAIGDAFVAATTEGVPFNLAGVALAVLVRFLVGVALHFGLYKPTGVSDRAQDTLVKD